MNIMHFSVILQYNCSSEYSKLTLKMLLPNETELDESKFGTLEASWYQIDIGRKSVRTICHTISHRPRARLCFCTVLKFIKPHTAHHTPWSCRTWRNWTTYIAMDESPTACLVNIFHQHISVSHSNSNLHLLVGCPATDKRLPLPRYISPAICLFVC